MQILSIFSRAFPAAMLAASFMVVSSALATPLTINVSGNVNRAIGPGVPVTTADTLSGALTANLSGTSLTTSNVTDFNFNLGGLSFDPANSTLLGGTTGSVGASGIDNLGLTVGFIDPSACQGASDCVLALFTDNTFDFGGTASGAASIFDVGGPFTATLAGVNQPPPTAVPEPSGLGLMLLGLSGLGLALAKKRGPRGAKPRGANPARARLGLSATLPLVILAAFMVPVSGFAAPGAQAASQSLPNFVDWRYYGNGLKNQRYQNLDNINPNNVSDLRPAWVFHTGVLGDETSLEVSPIVVHGTMYVTTGVDDVFALNAATGKQKWVYHPTDLPDIEETAYCCGRDNRGVAYGAGSVYLGRLDAKLVALNARTGKVRWETAVANFHKGYSITMAPQYADGLVIVGLSGGEYDTRGQVVAYNAATGKEVWRFYTTGPNGTWAGDSWKHGGAPAWGNPSVDRKRGLVYVGTGNPSPDFYGGGRAGKNLYSNSLVALDLRTGKVRWYFQEVHHGLWDYDGPQPPLLFALHKGGKVYPAVGHCHKNGNYYILNRQTGKPLYPVTEKSVPTTPAWQHPWPTQPVSSIEPLTPLKVLHTPARLTSAPQYTPPRDKPLLIQPGAQAGCEWSPAAYSPRTQYIYYGTRYQPVLYQSHRGNRGMPGDIKKDFGSKEVTPIPGVDYFGIFGAVDATTGKVVWKHKVPQLAISGMTVAGNLVFYGEENGQFHAANAKSGQVLWTFDGKTVPHGGGAAAPPATYVANGKEFVVEAFGGNAADRSERKQFSPVGDAIVAFALPCSQGDKNCKSGSQ